MAVRAKFKCTKIEQNAYQQGSRYTFAPQYDPSIPEDENYAKYTPAGEVWMLVDNPAVEFELGADYFLDFTRAEETATA